MTSAVGRVAKTVRDGIRDGRYVPGQRLVEADLIRDLGVGRNALREALSRLSSDGLIVIEPHRGASVRRLSRHDVGQLYDLREVLEGLAARLVAQRSDEPGVRAALTVALTRMREAAATGDFAHYMDENIRFHRTIVELSGNPRLAEVIDGMQIQTFRIQFRCASRVPALAELRDFSVTEHLALAEAMHAGDAVRAEELMRDHLRHTRAGTMRLPDSDFA
jgi:DNA-binding GntR family transcriptional regulator